MDEPDLDRAEHTHALHALARVNAVSLGAWRLRREVARLARRGVSPVRVLDVACGGGDLLAALGAWAARVEIPLDLHGCDRSPVALEHAREATSRRGVPLTTHRLDVVRDPLPGGFDFVCCSLFLHHLEAGEAVELLRKMAGASRGTVLIQDLRRTRLGYGLAWIGLHTLTRSKVARSDGLLSVKAAFSMSEAAALTEAAGLSGASLRSCWPQRFLLTWRRA